MTIAMVKGLAAGGVSLLLAYASGARLAELFALLAALLLGLLSYGVSLVLFVYVLRHFGGARTSAHFSTAPFIGAALTVMLLHEPLTHTHGHLPDLHHRHEH